MDPKELYSWNLKGYMILRAPYKLEHLPALLKQAELCTQSIGRG